MKKILSLTLVLAMVMSMGVTTAFAADHDVSNGTTITLVGSEEAAGESYTVTVPAELQPGQSGNVTASGTWSSKQTLKVTAPSSVTLSYGDQSMDVGITFAGINQVGSDTAESSATAPVAVEDASVLFGTWTGHLTYDVEMVDNVAEMISFTVINTAVEENGGATEYTYQAEAGMTWGEWCDSDYNVDKLLYVDVNEPGYIQTDIMPPNKIPYASVYFNEQFVLDSDVIVNNGSYYADFA